MFKCKKGKEKHKQQQKSFPHTAYSIVQEVKWAFGANPLDLPARRRRLLVSESVFL